MAVGVQRGVVAAVEGEHDRARVTQRLAGDVAVDTVVATALEGGEVPVALVSPLRVVEGGGLPVLLVRVAEPPVTVSVDNDGSYRSQRKRRKTVKRELRLTPRVARSSQQLQILHCRNDKERPLTP